MFLDTWQISSLLMLGRASAAKRLNLNFWPICFG